MKIKLDENIPASLSTRLVALGHDVDSVPEEGLTGHSDTAVWSEAQASGRFLVTQDLDFSDVRRFAPGAHAGILLVRLKRPGRKALMERLDWIFRNCDVSSWFGCFVVATEVKVRVHHPVVSAG